MIRRWTITLVIICVAVVLGTVWHRCARTVPLAECSEVYRRYADTPGINAAYVKDYRVNDTIAFNATLLEATTDSAWNELCLVFSIPITFAEEKAIKEERDALTLLLPENCSDCGLAGNELAVSSLRGRYICVFHNIDTDFRKHIVSAIYDKMFDNITNKQNFISNEKSN